MVGIGIVGLGFMGYTHFVAAREKLRGGKVTALATRSEKKRSGDWRGIQGNFGPPAGQVDLSNVNTYADYRDLLADPEVDLVDICLPTDMHEAVAVDALKAGKHVLVEKPISVDLQAAGRMVKAAETHNRLLMVAQVLPYFPEFRFARECIAEGRYGKLLAAHFRRVISPPKWSQDIADFRKMGGWGIDLHIHDNHFIGLICGSPRAVFSRGLVEDGFVNHVHTQYVFDDPQLAVSCVSGGIATPKLQFAHGFEIYLEDATLIYSFGTLDGEPVLERPLTLIPRRGKLREPKLKGGGEWYSPFAAELQDAVKAVKTGEVPEVLSDSLAHEALKLCYAEAKSITTGKTAKV